MITTCTNTKKQSRYNIIGLFFLFADFEPEKRELAPDLPFEDDDLMDVVDVLDIGTARKYFAFASYFIIL